ncbi:hypothetical protein HanPI659440_Chr11g0405941 [Helianthus annuus]|nr:hypothetical protein HanPI659440_Chr11g0405941 [Helianthus annuus]
MGSMLGSMVFGSAVTEKVDLENTVVDEKQRMSKEVGATSRLSHEKYSGRNKKHGTSIGNFRFKPHFF